MEELVRYKSREGTNDVRALESNKTTCLADEDNRSLIPIDRHEIKSKVSGQNQSADKLDFRIVPPPGKLDGMNGDPFAQLREEILPFLKLRFEFVRRKKRNLAIYFRRAESKFGKKSPSFDSPRDPELFAIRRRAFDRANSKRRHPPTYFHRNSSFFPSA